MQEAVALLPARLPLCACAVLGIISASDTDGERLSKVGFPVVFVGPRDHDGVAAFRSQAK